MVDHQPPHRDTAGQAYWPLTTVCQGCGALLAELWEVFDHASQERPRAPMSPAQQAEAQRQARRFQHFKLKQAGIHVETAEESTDGK